MNQLIVPTKGQVWMNATKQTSKMQVTGFNGCYMYFIRKALKLDHKYML